MEQPVRPARGLITQDQFDWQDDLPPRHSWQDTVIYETHVRGFLIHASSSASHPGSYLGLIDKIPYLRALGITAIELMPVQEFHDCELDLRTGRPRRNYWGYDPVALFAPKASYAATDSAPTEFKTTVRELHKCSSRHPFCSPQIAIQGVD